MESKAATLDACSIFESINSNSPRPTIQLANSLYYLINNGNAPLCGKYLISKFRVLNWLAAAHSSSTRLLKKKQQQAAPKLIRDDEMRLGCDFEKFWKNGVAKQTIRPERIRSMAMTKLYQC